LIFWWRESWRPEPLNGLKPVDTGVETSEVKHKIVNNALTKEKPGLSAFLAFPTGPLHGLRIETLVRELAWRPSTWQAATVDPAPPPAPRGGLLAHHRLRHFVVLLVLLGLSSPAHATPPGHDPAVQDLEAECVMAHASAYGDEEGKQDHKACFRLGLALLRGIYLGQWFTIDLSGSCESLVHISDMPLVVGTYRRGFFWLAGITS
jgi:hypothetical protein